MKIIFGKRLRQLLNDSNTSQQDLADYAGVSKGRVSQWLNEENTSVKGENLLRAADFFGISPHNLFYGVEQNLKVREMKPAYEGATVRHMTPVKTIELKDLDQYLISNNKEIKMVSTPIDSAYLKDARLTQKPAPSGFFYCLKKALNKKLTFLNFLCLMCLTL